MIKILDKYLLKQFLLFLIGGTLLFVFIFVIVDMSDNLTSYIDSGRSVKNIFFIYYYQIPSLIILLFPIGSLIALFFSIGIMVKNNELMAIKSAGISIYRFLFPLFILIIFISIILFIFNEMYVVKANKHYRELKERRDYSIENIRDFHVFQNKNTMFQGKNFKKEKMEVLKPTIYYFDNNNHIEKIIKARKGYYHNNKWIFKDVSIIEIKNDIVIKKFNNSLKVNDLTIKPEDILLDISNVDIYSIHYLSKIINSIKKSGYDYKKQESEIVYRFYYLIITFIIILIGSAFVVNIKTQGLVFGLSMSILMSFIYWGVLQSFRSYGENGNISPFVSLTMPNILFLLMGVILLIKSRK